jgi:glutamyl-tRNA synthetase
MKTVRTRIAPSPTGQDIHIGNLYTALINWTLAQKYNGKFVIRIEDTDRQRYQEGAEEKILSSVKAYGLDYDEGPDKPGPYEPYRQSDRLPLYKKYAQELVHKGKAYYCFCTPERLTKLREEQQGQKQIPRYDKYCLLNATNAHERIKQGEKYVIRLNVPADKKVTFHDVIRGEISFESNQIDDQIILKSDGYPTYHLGVVVDDHLMEISHVIRAEEWISSTPKHILLYEAFQWEFPIFAHLPILRNPDHSKLSKRKNPVWASWYLEQGYLPEAVLNFLSLMGWSHPDQKEIFPIDEFIRLFKLEDIHPVGPIFDLVKLTWMNQQYIQHLSDDELLARLKKFYPDLHDDKLVRQLLPLVKERMQTLKDFSELTGYFFTEPVISARDEKEKEIAEDLQKQLSAIPEWRKDTILASLKDILSKYSVRMPILYYLITGKEKGLPLPESLEILGKEKVLIRLQKIFEN